MRIYLSLVPWVTRVPTILAILALNKTKVQWSFLLSPFPRHILRSKLVPTKQIYRLSLLGMSLKGVSLQNKSPGILQIIVFITKASYCCFQGKWNNDFEREEKLPHCNELVNRKGNRPSPVRIPVPNDLYKLRYKHRPSHAWNSNWDPYTPVSYCKKKRLKLITVLNLVPSIHGNLNQNWIDSLIDSAINNYNIIYNRFIILLYYY